MGFLDNAYYQQMGEAAREQCVKAEIIKWNQCELREEDLTEIVKYFNGQLCKRELQCNGVEKGEQAKKDESRHYMGNSFLKKEQEKSEYKFTIEYSNFSALDILHELGHAFLELEKMAAGEVRGCDDINGGINELNASKFARAFIMPRALFEKIVVENSMAGVCDIQQIADAFGIDYWQVVLHGRQLQVWR